MKCKYPLPHQPQKCGLLNSSWNDPVAKMERSVRAYEKECIYISWSASLFFKICGNGFRR